MRHAIVPLRALLVAVTILWIPAALGRVRPESDHTEPRHTVFASIPGSDLRSILPTGSANGLIHVSAFALQRTPVTNRAFLEFVTAHPEWQRSRVSNAFADGRYLQHWRADLDMGSDSVAEEPVTNVSWFAASAFCRSHGARLPIWHEWELAAAANEQMPDARHDSEWQQRILGWYSVPSSRALPAVGRDRANFYGLHDLHGLVWEWVEDFNALFISATDRDQRDSDLLRFCGGGALSVEDRENYPIMMRLAMLSSLKANSTTVNVGFRCALPGEGTYHKDVMLETQDGGRTPLSLTHGRARIVTMFYSSCPMACPLTVETIRALERELTSPERASLDVLMVTFDPENDTRQVLHRVATERRVDTTRWTLARTASSDVRTVSEILDIAYRKLANGNFNHSSELVLMDGADRAVARSDRIGSVDPQFLAAIRQTLAASGSR